MWVVGGEWRLFHFQAPLTPWLSLKFSGPAGINNHIRQSSPALCCLFQPYPRQRGGMEISESRSQLMAIKGFLCWGGTSSCPISSGQDRDPALGMFVRLPFGLCCVAKHRDFGGEGEMSILRVVAVLLHQSEVWRHCAAVSWLFLPSSPLEQPLRLNICPFVSKINVSPALPIVTDFLCFPRLKPGEGRSGVVSKPILTSTHPNATPVCIVPCHLLCLLLLQLLLSVCNNSDPK